VGLPPEYVSTWLAVVIVADLLLLAWFADHRLRELVVRPVERMIVRAERVAGGDHTHLLPATDTRELRRLSAALNQMAGRLIEQQQTLAENVRSLDETNRALSDARIRLVRAEKLASIGRLAAGVAHEVGNPLGAILGYLEVGKRRGATDREWTDGIAYEVRRIDRIVRGLMEYARPKAAAVREIDVNEVVRATAEMMGLQGRFKKLELRLRLGEVLPPVRADAGQLEQVVVNLLLNAEDAAGENGGGLVEVSTATGAAERADPAVPRRRTDPAGVDYSHLRRLDRTVDPGPAVLLRDGDPVVEIRVADDGPGVAPELRNRVFEPFFTTKEPGRGTGLGLAVSARLIEGMGGTVDVLPRDGGGAVFRVRLPVATTAREEPERR
jgi:hypothetical protein